MERTLSSSPKIVAARRYGFDNSVDEAKYFSGDDTDRWVLTGVTGGYYNNTDYSGLSQTLDNESNINPNNKKPSIGNADSFKFNAAESAFRVIDSGSIKSASSSAPGIDKGFSLTPGPKVNPQQSFSQVSSSSSIRAPIANLTTQLDEGLLSPTSYGNYAESSSFNYANTKGPLGVSRSPDVIGIVSHLLNSHSPAAEKIPRPSLLSSTNDGRASLSPSAKHLYEAYLTQLIQSDTPVVDEINSIEPIDLKPVLNAASHIPVSETEPLKSSLEMNANSNLFYSDLSSNAKPWPGATRFEAPTSQNQPDSYNRSSGQSFKDKINAALNRYTDVPNDFMADTQTSIFSDNFINQPAVLSAGIDSSIQTQQQSWDGLLPPQAAQSMPQPFVSNLSASRYDSGVYAQSNGFPYPLPQSRDSDILRPKPSQERVVYSGSNSRNSQNKFRSSKDETKSSVQTVASSIDSDGSLSISSKKTSLSLDMNSLRLSTDSKVTINTVNKQEFVESPRSKAAYKDFGNQFRNKYKISPEEAEQYATQMIHSMPEHARWRVFMDLAELHKKNNDPEKSRECYIKACSSERRASAIWLEWSKMEEENGHPIAALHILTLGIMICKLNDTLLPRLIKLYERLHHHTKIRGVLSALKYETFDRAWKSILEGSLFEARAGNFLVSRRIFKYLMKHVPWYGPIYLEAFRLEEREGRDDAALKIIRRGLLELPRYGPLWFGLIRIMERRDIEAELSHWQQGCVPRLANVNVECNEAVKSISKELTWRVHYERFQAEERASEFAAVGLYNSNTRISLRDCRDQMLSMCRRSLTQSLLLCPANLRWKLFLVGARLELGVGHVLKAQRLISRAYAEVPAKSKASVIIEASRLEEYIGNISLARKILRSGRIELQNDWRTCLESILLEARSGQIDAAIDLCKHAVSIHSGTGRIWSLFIQLYHGWKDSKSTTNHPWNSAEQKEISAKEMIIRRAIAEVPKSGEVWCEQGRCRLNPLLLEEFDLGLAQQSFAFAIQFTPQYGDTFIECLRLEFLCRSFLRIVCGALGIKYSRFIKGFLDRDEESDLMKSVEGSLDDDEDDDENDENDACADRRQTIEKILTLQYQYNPRECPAIEYDYPHLLQR